VVEMKHQETIAILGATSTIAEHVARIWSADDSVTLILIGRNVKKLNIIATNLSILNPSAKIICKDLIFENLEAGEMLINEIFDYHQISKVLIAFGTLPDQIACQEDVNLAKDSLIVNGVLPILYCEMFITKMNASAPSLLALIGSVAGDRGRKSNYFYGAAKSMMDVYLQGVRHRLAKSSLHFCMIKPGPTKTAMTESLDLNFRLADPEIVAKEIVRGIQRKKSVIYTPSRWRIIMIIIRSLPESIFHKLNI